jgi:hypothetical protein
MAVSLATWQPLIKRMQANSVAGFALQIELEAFTFFAARHCSWPARTKAACVGNRCHPA